MTSILVGNIVENNETYATEIRKFSYSQSEGRDISYGEKTHPFWGPVVDADSNLNGVIFPKKNLFVH